MKQSTNYVIQCLALLAQGLNVFAHIWPASAQPYVLFIVFLIQGASAIIAHNYNPDGTPAKVAYLPAKQNSNVVSLLLLLLVMSLACFSFGCGKQDLAKGLRIGAITVETALDLFTTEEAQGGIVSVCDDCPSVNDQAQRVKAIINQAADFVIAHADDFTAANKDELLALIDDGLVRTRQLAASGQLFTNPKKRDKFIKVISLVEATLNEVRGIIAASTPKPTPTPQLTTQPIKSAEVLLSIPWVTLYAGCAR